MNLQDFLLIFLIVAVTFTVVRATDYPVDAPSNIVGNMPNCIYYKRKCCTKMDPGSCFLEIKASFPCKENISCPASKSEPAAVTSISAKPAGIVTESQVPQVAPTSGFSSSNVSTDLAKPVSQELSPSSITTQASSVGSASNITSGSTSNVFSSSVSNVVPSSEPQPSPGQPNVTLPSNVTNMNQTSLAVSQGGKPPKKPCPSKNKTSVATTSGANITSGLNTTSETCTKCNKKHRHSHPPKEQQSNNSTIKEQLGDKYSKEELAIKPSKDIDKSNKDKSDKSIKYPADKSIKDQKQSNPKDDFLNSLFAQPKNAGESKENKDLSDAASKDIPKVGL